MKLSSFKVGEYAIDSDGEVVKILSKNRNRDGRTQIEIIVKGNQNGNLEVGTIDDVPKLYGRGNADEWKRWTPHGNSEILKKIEETKKSLADLEKAYRDSLKPKIEFIPGMAYDISQCSDREWNVGIFTNIDSGGDHLFIVDNDGKYFCNKDEAQKAKPLTKPNQKKAAKIIYDFIEGGKFPQN